MFLIKVLILTLIIKIDAFAAEEIVTLKYGKVRGIIKENNVDGSQFLALYGVPYAQPIPDDKKFTVINFQILSDDYFIINKGETKKEYL